MPGLQRLKKKPCHPGKLWEIAHFVLILNPDWSYRVDLVIKRRKKGGKCSRFNSSANKKN